MTAIDSTPPESGAMNHGKSIRSDDAARAAIPWEIEYSKDRQILIVKCQGEIDLASARRESVEAVTFLKNHPIIGVLADCSRAVFKFWMAELYWLPDNFIALGVNRSSRLALLLPLDPRSIELCEFFQLRCANTGFNVQLFNHRSAAEAWLCQPPSAATQTL